MGNGCSNRFMILRNAGWMLILLVLRQPCFSQDTALIRLIQSDEISYDRRANANVQVLTGNIILEHDNIYLYCDTAYLNEVENRVEAMGDVHVESRDTLHLYGKHIWYDGNTKIGEIEREVRLIDDQTTLYSEYLIYNRLTRELLPRRRESPVRRKGAAKRKRILLCQGERICLQQECDPEGY